jgi:hypothetical protein
LRTWNWLQMNSAGGDQVNSLKIPQSSRTTQTFRRGKRGLTATNPCSKIWPLP